MAGTWHAALLHPSTISLPKSVFSASRRVKSWLFRPSSSTIKADVDQMCNEMRAFLSSVGPPSSQWRILSSTAICVCANAFAKGGCTGGPSVANGGLAIAESENIPLFGFVCLFVWLVGEKPSAQSLRSPLLVLTRHSARVQQRLLRRDGIFLANAQRGRGARLQLFFSFMALFVLD
jgi:hypothetical protein